MKIWENLKLLIYLGSFLFKILVKNLILYYMTKLETTAKVQKLRQSCTDEELVKKIGISKPTLYSRIANHKWKVAEIFLIEKLT